MNSKLVAFTIKPIEISAGVFTHAGPVAPNFTPIIYDIAPIVDIINQ